MTMRNLPPVYLIGAIVAVMLIVAGAAIALPSDNVSEARFGLVLGLAGTVLAGLLALARSNDAANVSDSTKDDTSKLVNGHLQKVVKDTLDEALLRHDADVHGITHSDRETAAARIVQGDRETREVARRSAETPRLPGQTP